MTFPFTKYIGWWIWIVEYWGYQYMSSVCLWWWCLMSTGLTTNKGGSWEPWAPNSQPLLGEMFFGGWHTGFAAVKAQHMSGYRCWLCFFSTCICRKMGISARDKERLCQAVIEKKRKLLVTQYNPYCLYDSYMVFWRILFMNNNGGSGNVGSNSQ